MTSQTILGIRSDHVEPSFLETVGTHIARVNDELDELVASSSRLVEDAGRHTLSAGGKRLRPALVAIVAESTGKPFDGKRAARIGAAMELVHMATLMHDDVIDHASTRRGRPTAGSVFGNTAAILTGDVLLAKAMSVLAHDGDLRIIRMVSDMVVQMAEGEVRELEVRGNVHLSEDEHTEILRMKTAEFVRACCQAGALLAGLGEADAGEIGAYGFHIGMAFQIVDDLLDYEGDSEAIGKLRATDFREGCATYPLILVRPHLTEAELALVERKFGNGVSDDELRLIVQWMHERGALAATRALAESHVNEAKVRIASLQEAAGRSLLETLAATIVARTS